MTSATRLQARDDAIHANFSQKRQTNNAAHTVGILRERTRAGLVAAVARGRKGGRTRVVTEDKLRRAKALLAQGLTVREAAARIKVGKTALYAALGINDNEDSGL